MKKMMKIAVSLLLTLCLGLAVACAPVETPAPTPTPEPEVTTDADIARDFKYSDRFTPDSPNPWDAGPWTGAASKVQSEVTSGSKEAYELSFKVADNQGKTLYTGTLPEWWNGTDIWITSDVVLEESLDLTNATIEFDAKFQNIAKALSVRTISGDKLLKENFLTTIGTNTNGVHDTFMDFVTVTEKADGWFNYSIQIGKMSDSSEESTISLEEAEKIRIAVTTVSVMKDGVAQDTIDVSKECKFFIDNFKIILN